MARPKGTFPEHDSDRERLIRLAARCSSREHVRFRLAEIAEGKGAARDRDRRRLHYRWSREAASLWQEACERVSARNRALMAEIDKVADTPEAIAAQLTVPPEDPGAVRAARAGDG